MKITGKRFFDTEKHRGLFWQLGLTLALGAVFFALSYKTHNGQLLVFTNNLVAVVNEEAPITFQKPQPQLVRSLQLPTLQSSNLELFEIDVADMRDFTDTGLFEDIDDPYLWEVDLSEVFSILVLENRPIFPGCENEPTEEARFQCFQSALGKHLKNIFAMPRISQQMGSAGRVFVNFIIERDGSVSNVTVVRSIDPYIDAEAVRVVHALPKFTPAKQRGKPVRTSYTLPIQTISR